MRVPRDGGLRARVVLGGAGEDFARRGRGEQFGWEVKNPRFEAVGHTCSLCEQKYHGVVLRARVGVLEDVRGAAGGTLVSDQRDDAAREWFRHDRPTPRTRCWCKRPSCLCGGALVIQNATFFAVQGNLANTYQRLGRLEESVERIERQAYILDVRGFMAKNMKKPS